MSFESRNDAPMLELSHNSHFWLYFALVAGIIVLPGMDMAFVMASSLVDGRKAGAAAVAGIVAGGMVHVLMGEVREEASRALRVTFARALLTCLLNPKAHVFMLALFPQFLRAEYASIVAQAIVLGAITAATQVLVYGGVAAAASALRVWLRGHAPVQVALGQGVGGLLLIVAAWTVWTGWQGWR